MEFLERRDIDTAKWNKRIADSPIENIFCYSWYLDAVAKNWSAFVVGDYETIVPIPFTDKLRIKSLYQPPFTREIDIFGENIEWEDLLLRLTKIFKSVRFRNGEKGIISRCNERNHQYLNLTEELQYSTNAKRLIKKADERFEIIPSSNPLGLIDLFRETTFQKIDSISNEDLESLEALMKAALAREKGELYEVLSNGNMVAGGFFLEDKKRITYLKGAALGEEKKAGVMYGLMNFAIQKAKTEAFETFDFGGSNIENVATFYKKFGAQDRYYYDYEIDLLPTWFRTLKRFKR